MRTIMALLATVAAILATAVRADTVEVTSTTLLTVGPQTRGGAPGVAPELVTAAPAYQLLNVSARNVTNSFARDLQLVVSTWGSVEIADRRWDAGTGSNLNAEVMTAYVSGRVAKDHLLVRLGRAHVMAGVGRMLQLDGGEAALSLGDVRLSGYAGLPVSQRFESRSGEQSWNPSGGDLAYGGRASYSFSPAGFAGKGFELGASANYVTDGGEPVRQEVGADARFQPTAALTLLGSTAYSLFDKRFSEGNVVLTWSASRKLHLTADWRFTAPDLFLPRTSILSVFSAEKRNDVGGGLRYELGHGLEAGLDAHLAIEPGKLAGETHTGSDGEAELSWRRGSTRIGVEASYLDSLNNGYVGARVFGRRDLGQRLFASADVMTHFFREDVNGQSLAVTGTLTAGVNLARGFSAVLSGRAGMTPYLEQSFDVMAKLVYNQTYVAREVR
jgi:hypothetical protein